MSIIKNRLIFISSILIILVVVVAFSFLFNIRITLKSSASAQNEKIIDLLKNVKSDKKLVKHPYKCNIIFEDFDRDGDIDIAYTIDNPINIIENKTK